MAIDVLPGLCRREVHPLVQVVDPFSGRVPDSSKLERRSLEFHRQTVV